MRHVLFLKIMKGVIAISLLALSGCTLESCINPDTYWPEMITPGTVKSSIQQDQLLLNVDSIVTMEFNECGYAYRDSSLAAVSLCIKLGIEDSHSFQFLSPSVKIVSESEVVYEHALEKINYIVFVTYEKDGSEQMDSSSTPPTSVLVNLEKGARFGAGRMDRYSFSADAMFYGVDSSFAPPLQRALISEARRREYNTQIRLHPKLGHRFIIQMPRIKVDGKDYSLPEVAWTHSAKPVCHWTPP